MHPRVIEDLVEDVCVCNTPHLVMTRNFLVKLSFLWETYIVIVKGNDTLYRCDYLEKA
jgi:hypothetical protein